MAEAVQETAPAPSTSQTAPAPTPAPASPSVETPTPASSGAGVEAQVASATAATPVLPPEPTTALGAEPPKTDSTPEVETKEPASQSDEPAPLPSYEAFAAPEGIALDTDKVADFSKMLGEFERGSKADHAEVQKLGQQLLDRHIAAVQNALDQAKRTDTELQERQKTEWKTQFEKDPEIGGARQEATVSAARQFIRTHGGSQEQQKQFADLMDKTGLGNHPALIRIFAKANTAMAEGQPLVAQAPVSARLNKLEKMYGKRT